MEKILINYSSKYRACNGDPLQNVELRTILDVHSHMPYKNKDQYGGMYCYLNPTKGEGDLIFSGLFFIDLDTKGDNEWISHKIMEYFTPITEKMPNVVCMKYSFNKGLHVFVYDKEFESVSKSADEYKIRARLWTTYFHHVVKNVVGIDLLQYKTSKDLPVIDTHNINPYQQLGLCTSVYKWNEYCFNLSLNREWIKQLHSMYPELFVEVSESNPNRKIDSDLLKSYRDSFDVEFNSGVPTTIDSNFTRFGLSGDPLRRKIAMCLLIRCGWDVSDAIKLCEEGFESKSAKEIGAWIKSYGKKDMKTDLKAFDKWMKWLFKEHIDYVEMDRDQYLNQVLDIDEIDEKYIYIISNTGTGKTEWIKRMVDEKDNVIAVCPNLAILDGKKGGDGVHTRNITYKVFDNKQIVNKHTGVMTTMEQVGRMNKEDLDGKILIVDEAHLLTSYLGLSDKLSALEKMLLIMDSCEKVIFLSATPSGERYIRNFKITSFIKRTNANVIIHTKRLVVDGCKIKGGVLIPCYKYIISEVMKEKNCILYSNRRRHKWDEAGIQQLIDDKMWGEYNSGIKNAKGKNMCYEALKGENGNRLLYDWVFATWYLGVGVEIKYDKNGQRVKEGHIYFYVDEGFDINFIEQSIGRFRDMEDETIDIHVHLYYSKNIRPIHMFNPEENNNGDKYKEYYKEAVGWVEDGDDSTGNFKYNILMQRFFGVSGKYVNPEISDSVNESVGKMMAYKVYNERFCVGVEDIISHVGKLPYKSVKMVEEEDWVVDGDGEKYDVKEKEFGKYICKLSKGVLGNMVDGNKTEDLLNGVCNYDIPYKNYTKVRKYIDILRRIYMKGWNLYEWVQHVNGEMSKIISMYKALGSYIKMNNGDYVIDNKDDFDLIGIEENLKKDNKKAELIFEKWFLDEAVAGFGAETKDALDIDIDPMLMELLDLETETEVKMFLDVKDKQSVGGKHDNRPNKKTYEVTMSDKLEKYGLEKGMKFEGQQAIFDFVFNASGKKIDDSYTKRWRKNRYIIAY